MDRARDAADIFTVTAGIGGGAQVRAGPLHAGFLLSSLERGLRGGEWVLPYGNGPDHASLDVECTFLYIEDFRNACLPRRKQFQAGGYLGFGTVSDGPAPSYWTQIDVVVGAGGTLRLGFNPGELLDFILGWTTLDIYGDDIAERPPEPPPDLSTLEGRSKLRDELRAKQKKPTRKPRAADEGTPSGGQQPEPP